MGVREKRGVQIGIVLIFALLSVHLAAAQATQAACNAAGGIWCGPVSGGSCANYLTADPKAYGANNCQVQVAQTVSINGRSTGVFYQFNDLQIVNVKLQFISDTNMACPISIAGGGGGSGGPKSGCGNQGPGGGNGGNICSIGGYGGVGNGGQGWRGLAGSYVTIYAMRLTVEGSGVLSVSGTDGTFGGDATGEDCGGFNCCGRSGGGGGGGGGAGFVNLISPNPITGTGKITANGGNGGLGGKQTNDEGSGTQCAGGSGNDPGGAGGGGGGGAGGGISSSSDVQVQMECSGGNLNCGGCATGYPGCGRGLGESGYPGAQGNPTSSTTGSACLAKTNTELCNDGTDNDGDLLVDMDDPDCYDLANTNSMAYKFGWDTTLHSLFNSSIIYHYGRSALNGSDASCGDDSIGICSGTPAVTNDPCNIYTTPLLCQNAITSSCTVSWSTTNVRTLYAFSYYNSDPNYYCSSAALSDATACNVNENSVPVTSILPCCLDLLQQGDTCPNNRKSSKSVVIQRTCQAFGSCVTQSNACSSRTSLDTCNEIGCQWTPIASRDVGYISDDGQFMCTDSYSKPITQTGGTWTIPGKNFKWASTAEIPPYQIMQGGVELFQGNVKMSTQYISNGDKWYYCDASGARDYGIDNVTEYGHPPKPPSVSAGAEFCVVKMAAILSSLGVGTKVINCNQSNIADCENLPSINGFCIMHSGQKMTYQSGNFQQDCAPPAAIPSCEVKDNGAWVSLNSFLQTNLLDYCNNNPNDFICKGVQGIVPTNPQSGFKLEDNCIDPSNCFSQDITQYTCQALHIQKGYSYTGQKICTANQFCSSGQAVKSSDTLSDPTAVCCLGQGANCVTFGTQDCTTIGGQIRPVGPPGAYECIGRNVSDTCCQGYWSVDDTSIMSNYDNANSFVCYKQTGNNYFEECCGIDGCKNTEDTGGNLGNVLNKYTSKLMSTLYARDGVPLHSILNFDVASAKQLYYWTGPAGNPSAQLGLWTQLNDGAHNWAGFEYLEFDIAYSNNNIGDLVLQSSDKNNPAATVTKKFDIKKNLAVNKGPGKWNHAVIQLPTADPSFNLGNITNMYINFTNAAGVSVLLDNFFLREIEGADNSLNYYCSGRWGKWIPNLDGATDQGFFGQNPTLDQTGPYKEACMGTKSFYWTGALCCGDDTRPGQRGEYFVDKEAACWQGATVKNDQTVDEALGGNAPNITEKSKNQALLYLNGNLYSCIRPASDYNVPYSFDGVTADARNFMGSITVEQVMAVRGSWICQQDDGWVRRDRVNRVRLLATIMNELANSKTSGQYTLFCGHYDDVVNSVDAIFAQDRGLTDYACAVRTGGYNYKIFLGLIVNDVNYPFQSIDANSFSDKVLARWNPLSNMSLSVDCSGAPSTPGASDFFTSCGNRMGFNVYYNKPFNIVVISDDSAAGAPGFNAGFIGNFWAGFTNFFKNLFGGSQFTSLPQDFSVNPQIKDIYLSVNTNKKISGIMEDIGPNKYIRVDYENLNTPVDMLATSAGFRYPSVTFTYFPSNYNQTIYANGSNVNQVNWKFFTAATRLSTTGAPVDFGGPTFGDHAIAPPEDCDIDASGNPMFPGSMTSSCTAYSSIYTSGVLGCISPGMIDTSSCTQNTVSCNSNTVCEPALGETISNCPSDCHTGPQTTHDVCTFDNGVGGYVVQTIDDATSNVLSTTPCGTDVSPYSPNCASITCNPTNTACILDTTTRNGAFCYKNGADIRYCSNGYCPGSGPLA